MNPYEIAVIYHPDLEIDLSKATAKVEKVFTEAGGKITKTDDWGKRKLAYPVAKQQHGIYVFYSVELSPQKVRKVEEELKIADEVIRYLIIKVDLQAIKKAETAKALKAKKLAAAEPGDDDDNDSEDDKE